MMVSSMLVTQGFFAVLIMIAGTSEASPVTNIKTAVAPHTNASSAAPFTLPPIITSRTKPVSSPGFKVDLNAEAQSISTNKKWFIEHGGNYKNITRRDSDNLGGMTMDLPDNAPPVPQISKTASVVIASSAQVNNFKFHAALSSTAYCRGVVPLGSWSCKNCLKYVPDGKLLVTFTSLLSDTNGYVLRSDSKKTIYLVFRGTNSIRNAVTDLTLELTKYPAVSGAKVHTGFLGSYNEVVGIFFPVVQAQLTTYPNYKVTVSGHSMGAAQALLAGLDFYQRDKRITVKNLSIYTIGSPRVGNPAFAYYVDSTGIPYSRSVNNRDIVPHLPPQKFGFLHPGVEAWELSSSKVQICEANIETNSCSNSIVPFTNILDHLSYYGINEGLCI